MPKHTKRKQSGPRKVDGRKCLVCGAEVVSDISGLPYRAKFQTPQWRKVPRGEQRIDACNKCGISYADLVKRYGREPDQAEYSVWQGSRSSSDSTTITDEDEDAAADALLRLSESPVFSFGTLHDSPEPTISVEAASVTPALPHDADPSSSVPPVLLVEVDPTETGVTRPPPAETVASKPEKVSFFPALSYHENRGLDQNYSAHPLKEYQSPPTPSFSDWIH